ncbi:MAG: Spore photoproduct lyase [Syntrophorhabdaceae bacterium PtaU1.Bin034]|nr:MAG: Spore photoproduct lyase [Syntrophorhabdaceae bacterium PtaU1.Bin034]
MNLRTVRREETKGSVVRDCPGTRHHICCGYKTIDLIEGCPLSCSYCIMRGYLNSPGIRVRPDADRIIEQIDDAIEREKSHVLRFGTGELSDSLALDRRLEVNRPIVEFFGNRKKALLELKSKWASIDHLVSCLNPYTIVSFSLAPQAIIDKEEKRTSPLYKRLKALRKAQDLGCFVGLHFDPVIIYDGFEKDYEYLIDDIARALDLTRVIWISLGLLRFVPRLMRVFVQEKRTNLLHGEFVRGEDGKYRYIKSARIRVFRMLYELLKEKEPGLFIYLCMERQDVWQQATGREVATSEDLIGLFDNRIKEFYGGSL